MAACSFSQVKPECCHFTTCNGLALNWVDSSFSFGSTGKTAACVKNAAPEKIPVSRHVRLFDVSKTTCSFEFQRKEFLI